LSIPKPRLEQVKARVDDLAIFGGEAAFADALHVGRPNNGNRDRLTERINNILDSRWLTNGGPYEQEFERRIADLAGVKYCVAMCNATVALEIAIRALGLSGEVIVPAFTFIATAHALQWQEITPVFCDIDPRTHTLDPKKVEQLITPRTTGIIGVHLWGHACDVQGLSEIANRRRLKLVFDSAHAFGCSYQGRMIGSFGDAEVFSFHATKFLNSLEGGAVVTNNGELAKKVRLMKNFGFTHYDQTDYIGTNGKMNEISAAVGLTNLESIDEFIAVNRRNYEQYRSDLKDQPGIRMLAYDESEKCNYQYVALEIADGELSRDDLQQVLWAENVLARRYFYPGCHRMEPYRSRFPVAGLQLPETEKLTQRVLTLPTGTAVASEQIKTICDIIKFAMSHGKRVHKAIERQRAFNSGSPGGATPASPESLTARESAS
jgi:dTDP-4-amino-4,6-dideoxygalactose transaminase